MCKNCVVVEQVSKTGAITHIGYVDSPMQDKYEQLLTGDIVIQTRNSVKRLSQPDYLKLWDVLKEKESFGVVRSHVPQESNSGCAVCGEFLITIPAIDAECAVPGCPRTKHGSIEYLRENEEEVRKEMEEFFGPEGAGHGKRNDPIELAVRNSLQCPNDHWVCSDCLTFNRDEIPSE